MSTIGIYHLAVGDITPPDALAAFVAGFGIGLIIGRVYNVVWHEETGKAISKMDAFGITILAVYVLFAIFRKKLFGHWFAGQQLSSFILWITAGIMLGRFLTLRSMIIKV